MDLQYIKKRIKDRKEEKKGNPVQELLHDFNRAFNDNDLADEVYLRMGEMSNFMKIIHAATENKSYGEAFYQEQVASVLYLLEERYDELQVLIDALIQNNTAKRAIVKAA